VIEFRSTAYLALGGNLPSHAGSPEITLAKAVREITEDGPVLKSQSRYFSTPCFPAGAGPDYVNAVIEIACNLTPSELLDLCHRVEENYNRTRERRWGMRTLDLDILSFDDIVLPDLAVFQFWRQLSLSEQVSQAPDQLILPHPRIQDRAFVLVPLCDIAPNWMHPVLQQTASELCALLPAVDVASIRPIET
jgi:2-amino-4-hydroxy-6-hydroxymethyldihydropteridine diphosphokinase